jgi:hypothetical protein
VPPSPTLLFVSSVWTDDEGPAPILNRLQKNIWWGQASNLMSVPTDCNQRDERLGWTADAQLSAEEALHNFDMGRHVSSFFVVRVR